MVMRVSPSHKVPGRRGCGSFALENPLATIAQAVILLNGLCATNSNLVERMRYELERSFGRVLGLGVDRSLPAPRPLHLGHSCSPPRFATAISALDGTVTFAPASSPSVATNLVALAVTGNSSALTVAVEQHP